MRACEAALQPRGGRGAEPVRYARVAHLEIPRGRVPRLANGHEAAEAEAGAFIEHVADEALARVRLHAALARLPADVDLHKHAQLVAPWGEAVRVESPPRLQAVGRTLAARSLPRTDGLTGRV